MKNELCNNSRRAFLGFLVKSPLIPGAVLAARQVTAAPAPTVRKVLMNDFAIAGFRYYADTAVLPTLTPGTRLALRPEPDNPHDSFAVEIHPGPAKLGYVPRFCNRHISRLLQDSLPLACEVGRVVPDAPPWEAVHVRVLLPQQPVPADGCAGPSPSSRF
ncbi:MAG: HIRAN domain-containing protein [Verrucomicrobia bacterium]|nr:HIRAN domain-containing protein [Verrucomicrobiota bacterium]